MCVSEEGYCFHTKRSVSKPFLPLLLSCLESCLQLGGQQHSDDCRLRKQVNAAEVERLSRLSMVPAKWPM